MYISKIAIKNFRLLESVELCLEKQTTVIVGRNNSGKTSLTELFRRLLGDGKSSFKLEDFSLGIHEKFWTAFYLHLCGAEEKDIRNELPFIKVEITVEYGTDHTDLGALSEFIIDLDPDCTSAKVNVNYALEKGKIQTLFFEIENEREAFFKSIKERVPVLFKTSLEAEDPTDQANRKAVDLNKLYTLMQTGFINAQRTLDDTTHTEKAVLGKVFEALFTAAASETASPDDRDIAGKLTNAVADVEKNINADFKEQLGKLISVFKIFGYPGLGDPNLRTETTLEVKKLLSNNTNIGYEGLNGVNLPESYNGLGPRNLIYILLKLLEFHRTFTSNQPASGVHLVFIEEPEAHLHPQMQTIFIRKLIEIAEQLSHVYSDGNPWPVQFVVTTHSPHISNEAAFDSMRYFLARPRSESIGIFTTEVKDLRSGLSDEPAENREFLHKYMTLTRCDLLFADRGVLIEGPTERLLLPRMIEKVDEDSNDDTKLSSKYLTVIEVGGAYAHNFFKLLDFLNLRTLIITDLDTVDSTNGGRKCKVSEGTHSSNACINSWCADDGGVNPTKNDLVEKSESEKILNNRRLSYQVPHCEGDACGRSFEDAFMLANPGVFSISGGVEERENQAWEQAKRVDKTNFALEYAIDKTDWVVPLYIEQGLKWLDQNPIEVFATETPQEEIATASPPSQQEESGDA